MNLSTQDDQLAVFANAAAHVRPGGCSVVEVEVQQLRRVPPGQTGWVFTLDTDHLGIETFDDTPRPDRVVTSLGRSRGAAGAPLRALPVHVPSELDLMAKITGFRVRGRWAGWDQAPFSSASHTRSRSSRSCRSRPHSQSHRICAAELTSVRLLTADQSGGTAR